MKLTDILSRFISHDRRGIDERIESRKNEIARQKRLLLLEQKRNVYQRRERG